MKKKTSIITGLVLLFLIIFSCEQEDQIGSYQSSISGVENKDNNPLNILIDREDVEEIECDETIKKDLFAGQHIYVGDLLLNKKGDYLTVTYDLSGTNWWLKETHLFVGNISDAPFTSSGNPKIGHFPHHDQHNLVKTYSYSIPLDDLEQCYSMIAHASVSLIVDNMETATETAFAKGDTEFSGSRWGWYSDICKSDCEDKTDESQDGSENSEDDETANNDASGQETDDPSGLDDENSDGCMDAYAYDINSPGNSICFYEDFKTWGWSNYVGFNDLHYGPLGTNYTYPIYASAYQCDVNNSMEIGYMTLHIAGGDGILYADISVTLTNTELSIHEFSFYSGSAAYPMDSNGNESIAFEDFDISLSNLDTNTYSVNNLDWEEASYFITHLKVCPRQ
jgi:hypothetical protein